jgi:hypothetical protein
MLTVRETRPRGLGLWAKGRRRERFAESEGESRQGRVQEGGDY